MHIRIYTVLSKQWNTWILYGKCKYTQYYPNKKYLTTIYQVKLSEIIISNIGTDCLITEKYKLSK